jgi:hypothetical protein
MNISPKQRFLENEKLAKQFLDMVDSEAFQRASELAMIAFLDELKTARPEGGDGFQQILGADRFLEILRALPEPPKPLPQRVSHNLQHELK